MPNPDTPKTVLELAHELDCGCRLRMSISLPTQSETAFKDAAECLHSWLTDCSARHRCELVNTENPSGIAPRGHSHAR